MKFEKAVHLYKKKIYNYIYRNVSSKEDAEDIFQSVFVSLYKSYDRVDKKTISAYLYRIAHNSIVDYYKNRSRIASIDKDVIHNQIETEENMYMDRALEDKNRKIKNALSKLSDRESQAVNLQFYEKKSYKEIAEVMNSTASAVDSLLIRAKRKLKKIISQDLSAH